MEHKMIITEKILDLETNTESVIERELTEQEVLELEETKKQLADLVKLNADKAAIKTSAEAKLAALGLTQEEIAALSK
jgi:hypothetical protein